MARNSASRPPSGLDDVLRPARKEAAAFTASSILAAFFKASDDFCEPTVLTNVSTDMVITQEETFGPVAPLHRFKTDDEALEYGIVGINEGIISPTSTGEIAPFGRMKKSGVVWF